MPFIRHKVVCICVQVGCGRCGGGGIIHLLNLFFNNALCKIFRKKNVNATMFFTFFHNKQRRQIYRECALFIMFYLLNYNIITELFILLIRDGSLKNSITALGAWWIHSILCHLSYFRNAMLPYVSFCFKFLQQYIMNQEIAGKLKSSFS